jgi:hypothetical protein
VDRLLRGALVALVQRLSCIDDLLRPAESSARLKDRCQAVRVILDKHRRDVGQALALLDSAPALIDDLTRQYNVTARSVYLVEQFVAGPLSRFSSQDETISKLCERICREIKVTDIPIVLTTGNQYFAALPDYGLIFSPPTEYRLLLNLPDLYHELAHHLDERGSPLVGSRFEQEVDTYEQQIEDEIQRLSRPVNVQEFRGWLLCWRNWSHEVAADAFATLLVGPAYAWANFHLMLRVRTIFGYTETHPADAARMEFILRILKSNPRFSSDFQLIRQKWQAYLDLRHPDPPHLYNLLHPPQLFTAVLDDVRSALEEHHFKADPLACGTITYLLNEAWRKLLTNPRDYNSWEMDTVALISNS